MCADKGNNGSGNVLVAKVAFLLLVQGRLRQFFAFGSKEDEVKYDSRKDDPKRSKSCNSCYQIKEKR